MRKLFFTLLGFILFLFLLATGCKEINTKDETLETEPAKIIIGKWELSKFLAGYETIDGKSIPVYAPVDYTSYYDFDSIGNVFRLYFENTNNILQDTGRYQIDTLLHFNNGFRLTPWYYEFSDYNKTLKISNAFIAYSDMEFIYIRIN